MGDSFLTFISFSQNELIDKLRRKYWQSSPCVYTLEHEQDFIEVHLHGFLLGVRPAECALALKTLGDLNPAVIVPGDCHYLLVILSAEQEHGF